MRINKLITLVGISVVLQGCEMAGAFYPPLRIYIQRVNGQAELEHATYNRQIKVREAEAELESAKLKALSEIERAKGVAEANKIIGDSLRGNESYLRYLWIQGLQTNQMQVVYVPTEANLPILESTRMQK
jgi:hypothetical protein